MRSVNVPVVSLSEVLADVAPNVLIVDIEGGELELLEGANGLGSVESIVLELHRNVYGAEGIRRIFSALTKLGFAYDTQLSTGRFVVFRHTQVGSKSAKRDSQIIATQTRELDLA
jgi:hypothetical protein